MPSLDNDGRIWRLDVGDGENRMSPEWLDVTEALLDDVASAGEPGVLLTTGRGKFFSNGLELASAETPDQFTAYVAQVERLLARILTLSVPTVAAINGHAFGAGAMLALAHDYRVMRADRGYLCLPEVDLGIPFTPGMSALVQSKVSAQTAVRAMTTGARFGAAQAVEAGLVEEAAELSDLEGSAVRLVEGLAGKDPATLGTIKCTMFRDVLTALRPTGSEVPE